MVVNWDYKKARRRKAVRERRRNMARFQCGVCGFVYDEEKEGMPLENLKQCPVCRQPATVFVPLKEAEEEAVLTKEASASVESLNVDEDGPGGLEYDPKYARQDSSCRYMKEIHEMAVSGKTIIDAEDGHAKLG